MNFVPTPCQELAIDHLLRNERAGLFMGMGLGKTVVTLSAFAGLQALGDVRRMLVVAPLRVATLTWPNEVEKWGHLSHLKTVVLRSRESWACLDRGDGDVFTINYEQLPNLVSRYLRGRRRGRIGFDLVVFDELTAAKNPRSKRIRAIRPYLERYIPRRWGLTGTPNPSSELELFAQIRLLDDGERLGRSFDAYRRTYFHAIDYNEYNWLINDGASEKIYAKISDLCLTLRQEDYADFAPPSVEDVPVTMPETAARRYRELQKELIVELGRDEIPVVAPNAAVLTGKLLQMTGGAVYREDKTVAYIHDAKLEALLPLLGKIRAPTIVATNYRHEQDRICVRVKDAVRVSDGDTDKIVRDWNAGKIRVLVTDPRSIGHGLNLQSGGNHIVWFSTPWSPELFHQLNARLARKGQEHTVKVYRLLCPGTIDDAVAETLRNREKGQRALLSALTNLRRLVHNA